MLPVKSKETIRMFETLLFDVMELKGQLTKVFFVRREARKALFSAIN